MRIAVSFLAAVAVAVTSATGLGYVASGLDWGSAWLALLLGMLAGVATWWKCGPLPPMARPRSRAEWLVVIFFGLFAVRYFCWVAFYVDDELRCFTPNNLGDLSIHLTFVNYFANGAPFWPQNPIFSGGGLQYPFGVDLFNSLLVLVGVEVVRGLVWVGLAGSAITFVALWRWGGAFVVAGFLFNGGFAFWRLWETGTFYDFQDAVAWKSIPVAMFVTQRGFLYAIPAGLFLFWSWRRRFIAGERGLPFGVELLLYATMPLFHLHTFLFLSGLLGYWFITAGWKRSLPASARKPLLQLGAAALLPAGLLVWLMTEQFQSGSMIHLRPGWMQTGNPFYFWLENFGILPLCAFALVVGISQRLANPGSDEQALEARGDAAFVYPALLWFAVTCVVMFAQWEWDNTKLMIWSYLILLPPIWAMLRRCLYIWRVVAVVLLFSSGALAVMGGMRGTGHVVLARSELDALRLPLREIPITATFACHSTYNHPLLLLGRKVVHGYEGHLVSHGYDITERKAALESLLRGEPGWPAHAKALGADYLFWGTMEREHYGHWPPARGMEPVLRTPRGEVYRLP